MRTAGLALALVATAQLTLLSSPAFADDSASASASGSVSLSAGASASTSGGSSSAEASSSGSSDKARTGWILVGVGSALGIGGLVVDIVGANTGHIAGMGGSGDDNQTDNSRTDLYFVGTSLLVAGIVVGIYGGSMVWSANRAQDPKASPPPEDDAKNDGVIKAAQARAASAPQFVVPVLSATF